MSSTPHKDISKQLFREEKEEICVNMKKNTQTHTSMLTVYDEILTPIGIKPVYMDTSSGESSLLGFKPFSNKKNKILANNSKLN